MAIEHYRAAKTRVNAEERSTFLPGMEIVVGIAKKAAGVADLDLPKFGELCADAIQNNSNDNLGYLLESLAKDVERIGVEFEAFEEAAPPERNALNALVSEAVLRASEAKSKDRIRRIARIVANALRLGPKENYEVERELIDAAIQIAEADAHILGVMMKHQGPLVKGGSGIADLNGANDTWKRMQEENKEFRDPRIHTSCARLQAQGLIIRMERSPTKLDLATNPYSLTVFGVQFCEWCLQEVGA